MYSILLVEDEKKILENLQIIIDSSDIGFGRVDCAHDGVQALEMCRKEPYDVILTDIRMPAMDGLELARRLKEEGSGAKIIFVTAFSEFDYVLQALRLGAVNFIMKPINKAELVESVKAALEDVPERVKTDHDAEESQEQQAFRNYFLKRWTAGDMDNMESTTRALMANVNLFLAEYNVVLFRPLCREAEDMAEKMAERLRRRWEVWQYCNQRVHVLILGGRGANARSVGMELSEYLSEDITCRRWFCIIGFSVQRYQDLSMTFRASMKTLDCPNSYMIGALCEAAQDTLAVVSEEYGGSAEELLEAENDQRAMEILNRMGDRRAFFTSIVGMLRLLEERYFQSVDDTNQILIDLLQAWDESGESICAAQKAVLEARRLRQNRQSDMSPVITRLLKMISEQYSSQMSLKQLGKTLNIHPNYLGYLFKKETGRFFSDYLNEVRIRKAEPLLLRTSENIADVARQVGYSDVRYFNQAFKLRNGMTPGKYRLTAKKLEVDENEDR